MSNIAPILTGRQAQRAQEYFSTAAQPIYRQIANIESMQNVSYVLLPNGMLGNKTVHWRESDKKYVDQLHETLRLLIDLAVNDALKNGIP